MVQWPFKACALMLAFVILAFAEVGQALMSHERKRELKELTRETWLHAYRSYKRVAFPADELLPLSCKPQGHDRQHPENTAVNDVMGDFVLTVVDSLDTFAILEDKKGFENAVKEILQLVSFDRDSKVQVFEVTIRMMGGLLSGHILATSPKRGFSLGWYNNELLHLAHDLGRRLLPAFFTPTGIPYPRVHLQHGIRRGDSTETCAAGAGSLLLEFGTLSRLTGDSVFEEVARKAFFAVWNQKSELNLLGNTINAFDGRWLHGVSSTGAGIDSFFEYAAKSYVMFGEDEWWRVWDDAYAAIQRYIRAPDGFWYRGAHMQTGQLASLLVDSLSAFFPGVQTLVGDLDSAIKSHAVYAFLWKRYGGLPELFDINRRVGVHLGYPLRPEFIESNLYLYRATKDEFYLEVAEQVLHDINNKTRVECGLAAVLDLTTGTLEDKMPSFVTSETLKYLYLTFDEDNQFNLDDSNMIFSTEGHMLEIDSRPIIGRRRKSFSAEAVTCSVHDPISLGNNQHFLSSSVARRTDFEHARFLAGYVIEDEAKEIREGRWSESGFCHISRSEDYSVELLFAPTADSEDEDTNPGPEKLRQTAEGSVRIAEIRGLRFSLTRAGPGSEAFIISKVGPYRVPAGQCVSIHDPVVLASIPAGKVYKVHLDIGYLENGQAQKLQVPARAASFGPSVGSTSPPPNSFAVSQPSLVLGSAPFVYGCEPYLDSLEAVMGKVVIVRRGMCSFAVKANMAALGGAKAVMVVNTVAGQDEIVPAADTEEEKLTALVPLVLISNATGTILEEIMSHNQANATVKVESAKDEVEPMILGGYTVLNVRLIRT